MTVGELSIGIRLKNPRHVYNLDSVDRTNFYDTLVFENPNDSVKCLSRY